MAKPKVCPSGKVCHPTRAAAEARRSHVGGGGRVYRCECGSYHLTESTHSHDRARQRQAVKARQRAWRD